MAQTGMSGAGIAGWVVAGLLGLVAIAQCSRNPVTTSASTAALAAAPAPATHKVSARLLKCRSVASATAPVLKTLARNDAVQINEEAKGWAHVGDSPGCWVATRYLAALPASPAPAPAAVKASTLLASPGSAEAISTSEASAKPDLTTPNLSLPSTSSARKAHRARERSRYSARSHGWSTPKKKRRSYGGDYYGSGCPCSGRQVCIGPRGGRYCITSGGNKRYGV
ncbi:hypothetical protein P6144_16500 [Sphingomonas sp. HITSZ_GF]|uniref:hypothetical protein n=1 Tax=Sphingomonas sp. HITSZ_GF TaxID=3037247 RepID=UPI00240CF079|nr:hypothetical protein [Sphingomonas sp. HITSZ_GF]MDG2535263.1 hypothetical protein [Sphingomonas sp. HITSZ_GF]